MNATQLKLARIARKARNQRDAARLWNLVDHQDEPESLWTILLAEMPWAFARRGDVNSMVFVYQSSATNTGDGKMRYNRADINSAGNAAKKLAAASGVVQYVFATACGFVVSASPPPFGQSAKATNGSKVWHVQSR